MQPTEDSVELQTEGGSHLSEVDTILEKKIDEVSQCVSVDILADQSRRFNLDLAPKVVYSRGKLVQLLISSNVAR